MNLNLFIIRAWDEETYELVEKKGIVIGSSFSEAAAALENNYGAIEEIIYLAPIGDMTSYEVDGATYDYFVKLKEEMIWS